MIKSGVVRPWGCSFKTVSVTRKWLPFLLVGLLGSASLFAEEPLPVTPEEAVLPPQEQETSQTPTHPSTPIEPAPPMVPMVPVQPSPEEDEGPPPGNLPIVKAVPPPAPNAPPALIQNQIELLIVEDESQNNLYVTTLNSSGSIVAHAGPPVIFGVRQASGTHRMPATWYPHNGVQDVSQVTLAEPNESFRGQVTTNGLPQEGGPTQRSLLPVEFSNPVLSDQALNGLQGSQGGQHTLHLKETLQSGGERDIYSVIEKKAHILLRRPANISCRQEQVAGVTGQACLIRHVEIRGDNFNSNDILFVMRSPTEALPLRYRVAEHWYPLGTPLSIQEFAHSRGIELFLPQDSRWNEQEMQQANAAPQPPQIEGGFYSASRHGRGDKFGIQFGTPLPSGESRITMSRIEVVLIDDQVTQNQYVTTLNSASNANEEKPLLYGIKHPGSGERQAIWYSKGLTAQSPNGRASSSPIQLHPTELFLSDSETDTAYSPALSPAGWQKLTSMTLGDSQQFRLEGSRAGMQHYILSHILKQGELQLQAPTAPTCRAERVEDIQGRVCVLRKTRWQGAAANGDIRFVLSGPKSLSDIRYRVGKNWYRLGDSLSLAEFTDSPDIEIFYVPPDKPEREALKTQWQASAPDGLLQLKFFSAARMNQGDRFTSRLNTPQETPAASLPPLQLSALKTEHPQVQAGENLQVTLQFNRELQVGESFYLRLQQKDNRQKTVLDGEGITLNQQPVTLKEGEWLEIKPKERAREYQLLLPTLKGVRTTELQLQASLNPLTNAKRPTLQARSLTGQSASTESALQQLSLRVWGDPDYNVDDQPQLMYVFEGFSDLLSYEIGLLLPPNYPIESDDQATYRVEYVSGDNVIKEGKSSVHYQVATTQDTWKLGESKPLRKGSLKLFLYNNYTVYSKPTETTLNIHITIGDRSFVQPVTLRLVPGHSMYAFIRYIKAIPEIAFPGETVQFELSSIGMSGDTHYLLNCAFSNPEILTAPSFRVLDNQGNYRFQGDFDEPLRISQNSAERGLKIEVQTRKDITLPSASLKCQLVSVNRPDVAPYTEGFVYFKAGDPPRDNTFYLTKLSSSWQVGESKIIAELSETPATPQKLYYKVEPIRFSETDKHKLQLSYRNGPGGSIIPLTAFEGSIDSPVGATWQPQFILTNKGMLEEKNIRFSLATKENDLGGADSRFKKSLLTKVPPDWGQESSNNPDDRLLILLNRGGIHFGEGSNYDVEPEVRIQLPPNYPITKEVKASYILEYVSGTASVTSGTIRIGGYPNDWVTDKEYPLQSNSVLVISAKRPSAQYVGEALMRLRVKIGEKEFIQLFTFHRDYTHYTYPQIYYLYFPSNIVDPGDHLRAEMRFMYSYNIKEGQYSLYCQFSHPEILQTPYFRITDDDKNFIFQGAFDEYISITHGDIAKGLFIEFDTRKDRSVPSASLKCHLRTPDRPLLFMEGYLYFKGEHQPIPPDPPVEPLQITLPTEQMDWSGGEDITIPITLNRPPKAGESLLFNLSSDSDQPTLEWVLGLRQAKLSMQSGGLSETVNLNQNGEITQSLERLNSDKLLLTIPGKMPFLDFNGKSFLLRVNWQDSANQTGHYQEVKNRIKPFEQRVRILTSLGANQDNFTGVVGKDGRVSHDYTLTWQRGTTLPSEWRSVKEQLQARATIDLQNIITLKLNGQPVAVPLPGKDNRHFCALNILNDSQQRQVPIAPFVSYRANSQPLNVPLGCGSSQALQGADWELIAFPGYYQGKLTLGFGFDFSDPLIQSTLPKAGSPAMPWQGTAEGSVSLEVQFSLNP